MSFTHSIPQTATQVNDHGNEETMSLGDDGTENSERNLFENTKLNKPKLPPL